MGWLSFDSLPGTRYVLYLRPFSDDGLTQEELLVRRFARFGRVVAIGRPGEQLPPVGAVRGQLPLNDWQDTVSSLIVGAHVVLVAAGPGPGTVWEFTEALRRLEPSRLVLLVYGDAATYDGFRRAVASEYRRRSLTEQQPSDRTWPRLPVLPDYPPLNDGCGKPRWDFALKGVIVFAPDWTATFTRFDPTARRIRIPLTSARLLKREFRPVMAQLAALPPKDRSESRCA